MDVFEELLPAQTRSYRLGLKLKLPHHVLKAIHSTKLTPEDCLLEVIEVFIMQEKPRPTRRLIAEALRSPAVGMPALARKLESAHFTDLTSSRESVPRKADIGNCNEDQFHFIRYNYFSRCSFCREVKFFFMR